MQFWELMLIAVSLSMDAFAVSMCRGLEMKRFRWGHAAVIALFFGGFQALMPLIGYFVGRQFEQYIVDWDHWIAFALLAVLGGKMIWDGLKKEAPEAAGTADRLNVKGLFLMAVATSIDALAVGVTFGFLKTNIWAAISVIGCVTFAVCIFGVLIGNRIGLRFKNGAEILGGAILILMGLKILLEHLGVLSF